MDTLAIHWEFSSGEHSVWEISHLYGFDVYFGRIVEGRYIPLRMVTRDTPLPETARTLLMRYVSRWSADYYASLPWACEEASKP
jgi:hypothetical protein